jgi:anti-sigma factor RsiW
MEHISEIELDRFLDDMLPFVRKAFVKLHLSGCSDCQQQLERIKKERKEFEGMAAVMRKLEDADRQSAESTRQTVTSIFQELNTRDGK